MDSKEKLTKLMEEFHKNESKNRQREGEVMAHLFYSKVILPAERENLLQELNTARAQVKEYEKQFENHKKLQRQLSEFDELSKEVYSATFDLQNGTHCMAALQHKHYDNRINSRKERLKLLNQRKQELEKEYEDDPEVAELLIMMKKDAEVVEELRILKEETKVLEQRRNEAMDRKINQRNAFILQLLEEKRQFEEKMKKQNEMVKELEKGNKEKKEIQQAIVEQEHIITEHREKTKKLEEIIEQRRQLKCNQLEYLDFSDMDVLSTSPDSPGLSERSADHEEVETNHSAMNETEKILVDAISPGISGIQNTFPTKIHKQNVRLPTEDDMNNVPNTEACKPGTSKIEINFQRSDLKLSQKTASQHKMSEVAKSDDIQKTTSRNCMKRTQDNSSKKEEAKKKHVHFDAMSVRTSQRPNIAKVQDQQPNPNTLKSPEESSLNQSPSSEQNSGLNKNVQMELVESKENNDLTFDDNFEMDGFNESNKGSDTASEFNMDLNQDFTDTNATGSEIASTMFFSEDNAMNYDDFNLNFG